MNSRTWQVAVAILAAVSCSVSFGVASVNRTALAAQIAAGPREGRLMVPLGDRSVRLYPESHALLIGMAEYRDPNWVPSRFETLPGELESVRAALVTHGFQIHGKKVHLNPTAAEFKRLMESFVQGHGYKQSARLVVVISGHGHELELRTKVAYVCPSDTPEPTSDLDGFKETAIPESMLRGWIGVVQAKHALFLFDSCFAGGLLEKSSLPELPSSLESLVTHPNRVVLTAGAAGEAVPARSEFTPAFVRALTTNVADVTKDGFVDGIELVRYLRTEVLLRTKNRVWRRTFPYPGHGQGEMVFELPRVASQEPSPERTRVPEAESQKGELRIGATEACSVQLNGESAFELESGQWLPFLDERALPVGDYHITAQAESDGRPFQRRVTVRESASMEVLIQFKREATLPPDLEAVVGAEYASCIGLAPGSREAQERQRSELRALGLPLEVRNRKTGMVFRYVPSGVYVVGSDESEKARMIAGMVRAAETEYHDMLEKLIRSEVRQRVAIPRGLYVGKYEVTRGEWQSLSPGVAERNDPRLDSVLSPMEGVSAPECDAWVERLSRESGQQPGVYRLLTEPEWEVACRGGTTSALYNGDLEIIEVNQGLRLNEIAWHKGNSGVGNSTGAHAVGSKRSNGWGLHDMVGNVWEWAGSANREGRRAFRGGGWNFPAWQCRSASRILGSPDSRGVFLGFRVMRVLPDVE